MDVRVLQLTIEAKIGDDYMQPHAEKVLSEYMTACREGRAGHEKDERFVCADGTVIRAAAFYRYEVSRS